VSALDALTWVVAAVLLAAGASKLIAPEPAARALRSLVPSAEVGAGLARALGVVETVVGLAVLTVGGRAAAALLAVAYLGVTVTSIAAVRRGLPSCGCFGERSARPTWLHVALNTASLVIALIGVVRPPVGVGDGLTSRSAIGAFTISALVAAAAVAVVALETTWSRAN
jgi:hypothetical protein